jgi:hypothetical protein
MFDLKEIIEDFFDGNQEKAILKMQRSFVLFAVDDFTAKVKTLKNKKNEKIQETKIKKQTPSKLKGVEIVEAEIVK